MRLLVEFGDRVLSACLPRTCGIAAPAFSTVTEIQRIRYLLFITFLLVMTRYDKFRVAHTKPDFPFANQNQKIETIAPQARKSMGSDYRPRVCVPQAVHFAAHL